MRLTCPSTGKSVYETLIEERKSLRPLPSEMPEPFDIIVTRKVHNDCLVNFEGRSYQYVGSFVQVRGCAGKVKIFKDQKLIATHPRHTERLLVIDQSHYEGKSTKDVASPEKLGRVTRALLECFDIPVEKRAVKVYEKLVEVIG